MSGLYDIDEHELPDLRDIIRGQNGARMSAARPSTLRRSPRKHTAPTIEEDQNMSKSLDTFTLIATSSQRRLSPSKKSPSKRSPLKAIPQAQAASSLLSNAPVLLKRPTSKPTLQTPSIFDDQINNAEDLARALLTDRAGQESRKVSSSQTRRRLDRSALPTAASSKMTRQRDKSAGSRFVLGEARCNEDLIDSDANDDGSDGEETDLSGFIVDDDAEISHHESMESESDSEYEIPVRKPVARSKAQPKRRLVRGRRKVIDSDDEEAVKEITHDPLLSAFENMRIDGHRENTLDTISTEVEVVDLTSPDPAPSLKTRDMPNTEISKPLGNAFMDKLQALRLSPPKATPDIQIPSKSSLQPTMSGNEQKHEVKAEKDESNRFTTPPATPPRSPTKLKSPSKLLSPSKKDTSRQRSPHRPSMDAFWDLNEVNGWNDQFSPRKAPAVSPRKAMKHFEMWSDSDGELERLEESDDLPSPCTSPTKARAPGSSNQSPQKLAKQRAQAEKKAKLEAKRAFDASKESMAQELLDALDQNVTGGQIAKLSAGAGGVKIIWSKTLRSTAGRANWRKVTTKPTTSPVKSSNKPAIVNSREFVRHHASIELAVKVIDRPERLYSTLAHEFCHLANFMASNIHDQPHGQSFCRWATTATKYLQNQLKVPAWQQTTITTKHSYVIEYKYAWTCVGRDRSRAMDILNVDDEAGCGLEYGRHSNSIDTETQRCGVCKGRLVQIRPKPRASPTKARVTPSFSLSLK